LNKAKLRTPYFNLYLIIKYKAYKVESEKADVCAGGVVFSERLRHLKLGMGD